AAHTAPGGSDQFRGHVEQGGLAGTVEPDDRHHLAGTEGEGDVVEGRDRGLPVVLADLVDLQHQAATALSIRSATSTGEASSGTVTAYILWGTRESIMFRDTPVYQPMPGLLSTVAEASRPARRRWT